MKLLGKKTDDCIDFSIIPEVIHNGTLVIDDIEDSSEMRRGKACTYKIFQIDISVNAGNAMYYLPLLSLMAQRTKLSAEVQRDVYEVYVQEMINLSMGQAMDIAWHRGIANADDLAEDDYLQMCAYKTGTLARMAAKMAAVIAGADPKLVEKLGRFAESIGVAFQMQDDILDLTGQEFAKKKGGVGQDITEGKRSLMVIYTLKKAKQQRQKTTNRNPQHAYLRPSSPRRSHRTDAEERRHGARQANRGTDGNGELERSRKTITYVSI